MSPARRWPGLAACLRRWLGPAGVARRWLGHAVFATSLVVVLFATWFVLDQLRRPPTPLEEKIATADRVLYYRLLDDADVSFQLSGTEDVIKLITHGVIEGNRGFDADQRTP